MLVPGSTRAKMLIPSLNVHAKNLHGTCKGNISGPCAIFTKDVSGTRKYQSKKCQSFLAQRRGTFQALCSKKEKTAEPWQEIGQGMCRHQEVPEQIYAQILHIYAKNIQGAMFPKKTNHKLCLKISTEYAWY